MQTLQSEAKRLIREHAPGDVAVARLSEALWWVLFTNKRRLCGHGKPSRHRAFYAGTYGPGTR